MKVRISLDGQTLEEKETDALGFREMLRHPTAINQGWRAIGDCTFEITKY